MLGSAQPALGRAVACAVRRAPVLARSPLSAPGARAPQPAAVVARIKSTVAAGATAVGSASTAAPRAVGLWLSGTAGAVAAMICLGGYTRLTKSGLSMVDWKATGRALPSNDEEWEGEFEKYKAFPEFQKVNRHISMEEFKDIYFVEWFHRMWGRGLGVLFLVPAAVFAARGAIPAGVAGKVAAAGALGAGQGAVGWWMVKSGLEAQEGAAAASVPRVSPYRLATHLGVAFTTYSVLTWAAMDCLAAAQVATPASAAAVRAVKPLALLAAGVAGVTAASGAFVAGNDAGRAYNDWPLMAGRFVPEQIWEEALGWRNVFENTATVQFDHRMLAYATLGSVGALTLAARRPSVWSALPPRARAATTAMGHAVLLQAALGISTLMLYVPVSLGTAHQGGALLLWSSALWLLHSLQAGPKAVAAAAALPLLTLAAGE